MHYRFGVLSSALVASTVFAGSALATPTPAGALGASRGMPPGTPMYLTRRAPSHSSWWSSGTDMTTTDQSRQGIDFSRYNNNEEEGTTSAPPARHRDRVRDFINRKLKGTDKPDSKRSQFYNAIKSNLRSSDNTSTAESSSLNQDDKLMVNTPINPVTSSVDNYAPESNSVHPDATMQANRVREDWEDFFQSPTSTASFPFTENSDKVEVEPAMLGGVNNNQHKEKHIPIVRLDGVAQHYGFGDGGVSHGGASFGKSFKKSLELTETYLSQWNSNPDCYSPKLASSIQSNDHIVSRASTKNYNNDNGDNEDNEFFDALSEAHVEYPMSPRVIPN
ncbi:hypothetical protein BJ085DRAFT_33288 [Dimargaris cristalligena]|uniref:Uncharacterized protein n=1 Tax=Dimargaris cristalligena TaxID=215637 RepID=A0A4P9ZUE8_9FUNG|nr:hypothetical protein BJ085DRAFT_33288 [Dimargaris cristalligena]|eukprot:RKP37226.1 hypothetical protein BJ085DRAFT_33288 [Dimargaris cristalligena]